MVAQYTHTAETWLVEDRILGETLATGVPVPDVSSADFQIDTNAHLFAHMQACHKDMGTVTAPVFSDYLLTVTGLNAPEVVDRLVQERCPKGAKIETYVSMLKKANARRQLESTLQDRLPSLDIHSTDPERVRDEAIRALQQITVSTVRNSTKTVKSMLGDVIDELQRRFDDGSMPGITTGLPTLDQLTGGFQGGDLTFLAARPAVGKTAMACNIALAAARAGKKIGFVSAEQPGPQIVQRLIAITGGVPAWKMRSPKKLLEEEWTKIAQAACELDTLDITIVDDPAPPVDRVASSARMMQCDMIIVDYVQRLGAIAPKMNDYERISATARGLKELARELNVPVIALSQLNRAGESGATMSNLRGSGELEQEADSILMLERNIDEKPTEGTLTLEKNRHGPVGSIGLHFDAPCLRFGERARSGY